MSDLFMGCATLSELPAPCTDKTGWPWTEESPPLLASMPNGSPWPRISVVTPSYNQGQFIEETIRSVLLQGYPNLAYTIIDGGSTDNSVEIIKKYEPWLAYWVSEPDRGQADAINKGWKCEKASLYAWLNSDDVYLPSCLETIATFYHSKKVGLIYGLCEFFDTHGIVEIKGKPYSIVEYLHKGLTASIGQPAAFVSREALDNVGLLDIRLKQSLDKDLWQRVAAKSTVLQIKEVIARFRIHDLQLSQKHQYDDKFNGPAERMISLQNLYSLRDLPAEIMLLKHRTFAIANLNLALQYLILRAYSQALAYTIASLRHDTLFFTPHWMRKFLRVLVRGK